MMILRPEPLCSGHFFSTLLLIRNGLRLLRQYDKIRGNNANLSEEMQLIDAERRYES